MTVAVTVAKVVVVLGAVEEAVAIALAFAAAIALAFVLVLDLAMVVVEEAEVAVPGAVSTVVAAVDHRIPPSQSLCCGCDLQRNTAAAVSTPSRQSDGWSPATVAAMLAVRQIPRRRRRAGCGGRRNGRGQPAMCA